MTVVDASVLVSGAILGDVFHLPSVAWLARSRRSRSPLSIPTLALPEVAGAIARRTGDSAFAIEMTTALRRTRTFAIVPLDDDLVDQAVLLASERQIRGADAVYVALALLRGVALVTWDREMLARGAGLVDVRTPLEF